jgi:hypothetical protein
VEEGADGGHAKVAPPSRRLSLGVLPSARAGEDARRPAGTMPALLSNHQHFADIIPGEKEFNRSEIVKEVLDMAVIEHAL